MPPRAQRFSCMLWALEEHAPFDHCLEIVAQAGYQGVELVGEFQKWSPQETRRVIARVRALGLMIDAMSGVKAGFAVPGESAAFFDQFADHLRSAQELGCLRVILLSGPSVEGLGAKTQRATAVENLSRAAEMAVKAGVDIVIESIDPLENPRIFLQSVTEGFAIARAVNQPNLKVLYDFYHEQRGFGNLLEKLEHNIDWVGLVHVADVPGRHEPGTGEIRYDAVFRKLAELKYGGWIAMEYYPTRDAVASLREARLAAMRAMSS